MSDNTSKRIIERDIYLDWIAGLLIIHMILSHIDQWSEVYTIDRILFFFMPWFFFKAGMFHKIKEQKVIIKDAGRRLLRPMIIFSIIGQIVITIQLLISRDSNLLHYISFIKPSLFYGALPANLALWFLGTLFIDKVIFNWLCLKKIDINIIIVSSISIAFCMYLLTDANAIKFPLPDYFGNVWFGLIFYAFGFLLKNLKIKPITVILLGIILITVSYCCFSVIAARNNTLVTGYYLLAIPFELGAIVLLNNIIRHTPPNLLRITCLHCIGKNSMSYYVTHWIIIIICDYICINILNIGRGYHYRCILIVTCLITLPILSYILNAYFGKFLGK